MVDFDKLIDNHLVRENRPKEEGRYYPSQIGTCIRKIWYSYKHPMDFEPDLLKIFEVGNILHDFVTEVLKSEKNPHIELLKSEVPLKLQMDDYLISGRVDDLMLVKADGKTVLVEVKSISDIRYANEAKPHHVVQLQFYMYASGVHRGVLLYIDKKNLKTRAHEVKYDEDHVRGILKRFSILHRKLVMDELPFPEAKETKKMNWMCDYCEYREKCDRDEK